MHSSSLNELAAEHELEELELATCGGVIDFENLFPEVDCVDAARREFEDEEFARRWIHGLSQRVRSVLLVWLGHHSAIEVNAARELLFEARIGLLSFRLTELAIAGRRTRAIEQVARGRLRLDDVDACLIQAPKVYDRLALAAKLCAADFHHLADVHYFDKAHTQGFTLLKPRAPPSTFQFETTDFFRVPLIQDILNEYEFGRGGERVSTCASLMRMKQTGRYLVFIKRENAPAKISVDGATTFGFIPEWIVLDVDPAAKDVRLAASSTDASVEIAEMILSVYAGTKVFLEESPSTSGRSNVQDFVGDLLDGVADAYKLRDITVRVRGGQIMLQVEEGLSSALLCARAETGFGTAIRCLENIRTLIAPNAVVTAEHCTASLAPTAEFGFALGPDGRNPIRVIPVVAFEVESTVKGGFINLGSDVAVLHLESPIRDVEPSRGVRSARMTSANGSSPSATGRRTRTVPRARAGLVA